MSLTTVATLFLQNWKWRRKLCMHIITGKQTRRLRVQSTRETKIRRLFGWWRSDKIWQNPEKFRSTLIFTWTKKCGYQEIRTKKGKTRCGNWSGTTIQNKTGGKEDIFNLTNRKESLAGRGKNNSPKMYRASRKVTWCGQRQTSPSTKIRKITISRRRQNFTTK